MMKATHNARKTTDLIDLIFDTETTGLVANTSRSLEKQPHIIEFYGCLQNQEGKIIGELDLLIKPPIIISKEITKITTITNEMVFATQPFSGVARQIADFVSRADRMIAHNLTYDMTMLNFEFERLGIVIPMPAKRLCTVEQTESLLGHRLSLTALHELLFDEPFKGAHRAREDVQALRRCFNELIKRGEI